MLQHLLFLRPSIEGVSVTTENLIFKLVYAFTCPLFLAFGVIFYTRVCFTDAINCVVNSTDSFKVLRAIDSYCLENSYTIEQGKDEEIRHYQSFYQYTGLIFLLIGSLCYVPYILWEWFENGLLKSLLQDMGSLIFKEEKKLEEQIANLARFWKPNCQAFCTYAYANVLCEACNFLILLLIFVMGEIFFGNFGDVVALRGKFPKVAFCSWDAVGPNGQIIYEGICTMNMNYLSEKLFIISRWWLVTSLILNGANLIYRYSKLRDENLRATILAEGSFHFIIETFLPRRQPTSTKEEEENVLQKYKSFIKGVTFGEYFVLKRIQANVPPNTFQKILSAIKDVKDRKEGK